MSPAEPTRRRARSARTVLARKGSPAAPKPARPCALRAVLANRKATTGGSGGMNIPRWRGLVDPVFAELDKHN